VVCRWVQIIDASSANIERLFRIEDAMTWKDKLELGLKNDAAFRKDNLPPDEVHGPEEESGPGRSPVVTEVRDKAQPAGASEVPKKSNDEVAAAQSTDMESEGQGQS
jgi:hypothetical protein